MICDKCCEANTRCSERDDMEAMLWAERTGKNSLRWCCLTGKILIMRRNQPCKGLRKGCSNNRVMSMQRASKDNELGLFWKVVAANVSRYSKPEGCVVWTEGERRVGALGPPALPSAISYHVVYLRGQLRQIVAKESLTSNEKPSQV